MYEEESQEEEETGVEDDDKDEKENERAMRKDKKVKEEEKLMIYYDSESEHSMRKFTEGIVQNVLYKIFPEKEKKLTLKEAAKRLKNLGKIWNLAEYPPDLLDDPKHCKKEERLMDMDGFVDEYQYLTIEAVDLSLTNIKVIPRNYPWLLTADLSGNRLTNKTACPITTLRNLVALKLNRNRITDPYLAPMRHLQYLGLSHNQIESLHRIYHPNLETLDLSFNLLREIDERDCWKHTKLRQLDLRGNKLKTTRGIEYSSLVELYLAQNRITQLKGLQILVNLQVLHLRDNPLSDLDGFSRSNVNLKYLNVRQCQIKSVEEFSKLRDLTGLKELVVKRNLFNPEGEKAAIKPKAEKTSDESLEEENQEEEEEEEFEMDEKNEEEELEEGNEEKIRLQILSYLPQLTRINKKPVTKNELVKMKEMLEELKE